MAVGTNGATRPSLEQDRMRRRRRLHAALILALACGATPVVADAGFLDLEWHAPAANADGSPLLDLAGYRVYSGTSVPPCPSSTFDVLAAPAPSPGPGEMVAATLTSLNAGATYWVRVSAVDTAGNESPCTAAVSGIARTDINPTPSALSFGSVMVGTTRTLDFTVQNSGETSLTGTVTSTAPFSVVSGGTLNVAPGAAQAVRVGFTPVAEQVYGASVTFTTNGDQVSRSVSGSGVAAAPTVTPAVLQFRQTAYTVTEGGSVTVTVTRTGGSQGGVTVSYAIGDGTATAGADYTARSGTLTFAAGVTSRTFTVSTARDRRVEAAETITLTLGTPQGGAVLGTPSTAIVTINERRAGRWGR
jgi:hypothetical protein